MHRDYKGIILSLLLCLYLPCLAENEFNNTQVTIYNNDLGLIFQEKEIALSKGANTLRIEGVSKRVRPTTVKLSFPKIAGQYQLMEQNYLYDLVNTQKIFDKYTGENVVFRLKSDEKITGILMNHEKDHVILSLPGDIIRILATENIIDYEFPSLPGGLILKPTLEWNIQSAFKGKTDAQLSYLTSGMSWNAEYILVLNREEKEFSLNSWISLNNNSGTTFENAKVKLIAGDIHSATMGRDEYKVIPQANILSMAQKKVPETREIGDYYLYALPNPITLRHSELKQVSLFDEINGKGRKVYLFENYSTNEIESPLRVVFRIENRKENNMGMAMPKGIVRVFKRDVDETLQFIGEDQIEHTSNKDTLRLTIGNAFDVKGKRTIIEQDRSSKNAETITVKIEIRNRKTTSAEVEVVENISGYWDIKKTSHDYQQQSSSRVLFSITVKADSSETISYTYTRRW